MARRAAVIISGGGSISPFTTPDAACRSGRAAGGTDTALREGLLAAGIETYTAPVTVGPGEASRDVGVAGFAEPPSVLPADMTADSTGELEESAICLARFLEHLHEAYGIDEVDAVGHSLGGILARSAHMRLLACHSPVSVVSLTSVGTPWLGSFVRDCSPEDIPMPEPAASYALSLMGHMRTGGRLVAPRGAPPVWMAGKEHGLDGLALTRIAGTYFTGEGDSTGRPEVFPHDGMCSRSSVWGVGADPIVIPPASCHEVPGVHSIYFARVMDLPWERSITWDPEVVDLVVHAIRSARHGATDEPAPTHGS